MRRAASSLTISLLALACTKGDPTAGPRVSGASCLAAAREVAGKVRRAGSLPPASVARLGCPELYSRPACAQAWSGISLESVRYAISSTLSACAAAYCLDLPDGVRACTEELADAPGAHERRLDALVELDRAALLAERFDAATADALSRRSLLWAEGSVDAPPPPRPPDPGLTIVITADGTVDVEGRPVADADLPAVLRRRASPGMTLGFMAAPNVTYGRAVDVLRIARAAGFEDIRFPVSDWP